ncbi:hypothetical protein AB0D10_39290 [Kitasatospora sp. NPDC048545]|uniref:hypothetical protein n=1 Tax=Kitasatospora sp. NPDC048545 TaxID=3157208 RepID=UPI0033F90483
METMGLLDTLTRFGATADLGGLRPLGAFPVAALGEPQQSGRQADHLPWPQWFQYGCMSADVCRCLIVNKVSVRTWYDTVTLPADEPGTYRDFPGPPGFPDLAAAFAAAGVHWERHREAHSLPQFTMRSTIAELPGVTVDFIFTTDDDPDLPTLYSAHATDHTHLCPEGP